MNVLRADAVAPQILASLRSSMDSPYTLTGFTCATTLAESPDGKKPEPVRVRALL